MGANERPPLLRSLNNDHKALVMFINKTNYEVEVLWINHDGQAMSYGRLPPGKKMPMRTFATHPWIFVESQTMDRFLANGKDVFYAQPLFARFQHLPRPEVAKNFTPESVYITLPMYTLRDLTLRIIKRHLYDDNDAYLLDIPKNLQRELAEMRPRKNDATRDLPHLHMPSVPAVPFAYKNPGDS